MKFRFSLRCLLAALVLPAGAVADTVIEGQVALPGRPTRTVINQRYEIVAKGGILAVNPPLAVVYLEGSFPAPGALPVMQVAQKDLEFQPTLLAIQTGTKVEFPNLDDVYHNIFSYSAAKRFDLGRYRTDEKPVPSQVFDVPGLVTLRCDIHEHMRALILVLDTPHFVVTDADGKYQLKGIPPGHYVLKAWLDSRTVREQAVEVRDQTLLHVDFK
jgi:plastocyanin